MRISALIVASLTATSVTSVAVADLGTDFGVGRSSTGQLKVEFNFLPNIPEIPISELPGIPGFVGDEPGFANIEADEPDEDLFTLDAGARIVFDLVSIDPGFIVLDPITLQPVPVGGSWTIGNVPFDDHPFWHVPVGQVGQTFSLSFRLRDIGTTNYGQSDVYTSTWKLVPAPSALALLGLGGLVAARRRRA